MNISIRKSVLISMMFAPVLFLFNSVIFSDFGPIFVLGICFTFCLSTNKILLTKNFIPYFLLFSFLIFYLIVNVEPVQFDKLELVVLSLTSNIIFITSVCFLAFYIGCCYGYTSKHILGFSEAIALFYLLIFIGLVFAKSLFGIHRFSGWSGAIVLIVGPLAILALSKNPRRKFRKLFFALIVFYLAYTRSRAALGGMTIFIITYYTYPYLVKNRFIYNAVFPLFLIIIIGLTISYFYYSISPSFTQIETIGIKDFDNSMLSGRIAIWDSLIRKLDENSLVWGIGSLQQSQFFISTFSSKMRNASSHNAYLEFILRIGLVGLLMVLSILFQVWKGMYDSRCSEYAKIGAASLFAILFYCCFAELIFTKMLIGNIILWLFWGVIIGYLYRNRNSQNLALMKQFRRSQ